MEGATIAVHYRQDRRAAEEVSENIGGALRIVQADIASAAQIEEMFGSFEGVALDILVISAGIWKPRLDPRRRQWWTRLSTRTSKARSGC
jgi:NAD(P)-dependent dehydrogenase (short-subunit alcohol dehydrogenase family)